MYQMQFSAFTSLGAEVQITLQGLKSLEDVEKDLNAVGLSLKGFVERFGLDTPQLRALVATKPATTKIAVFRFNAFLRGQYMGNDRRVIDALYMIDDTDTEYPFARTVYLSGVNWSEHHSQIASSLDKILLAVKSQNSTPRRNDDVWKRAYRTPNHLHGIFYGVPGTNPKGEPTTNYHFWKWVTEDEIGLYTTYRPAGMTAAPISPQLQVIQEANPDDEVPF